MWSSFAVISGWSRSVTATAAAAGICSCEAWQISGQPIFMVVFAGVEKFEYWAYATLISEQDVTQVSLSCHDQRLRSNVSCKYERTTSSRLSSAPQPAETGGKHAIPTSTLARDNS